VYWVAQRINHDGGRKERRTGHQYQLPRRRYLAIIPPDSLEHLSYKIKDRKPGLLHQNPDPLIDHSSQPAPKEKKAVVASQPKIKVPRPSPPVAAPTPSSSKPVRRTPKAPTVAVPAPPVTRSSVKRTQELSGQTRSSTRTRLGNLITQPAKPNGRPVSDKKRR